MPDPGRRQLTGAAARARLLRRTRRFLARHRVLLAAGLLLAAVVGVVETARPSADPAVRVAVASRDLPPGTPLSAADVTSAAYDPTLVPDGSYSPAEVPVGRPLAGPMRAGEPLTDAGLVSPALTGSLPTGQVLTTINVRSPAAGMVAAGDVVRVVATPARGSGPSTVLAPAAAVLVAPGGDQPDAAPGPGPTGVASVVVAVPEAEALALAGASTSRVLDLLVAAPGDR